MGLTSLIEQVKAHEPRVLGLDKLASAAVLIAITDQLEPEVILTLRSSEMPTHKGEVAFPGGKVEDSDADFTATALREAHEEIGLSPDSVIVIGELDQVVSRYGFLVTPVLGIVPENVTLTEESGEIDSVFRVPLKFFLDGQPDQIDQFGSFRGPRWYFERYTIWGLTAVMLAEMFNRFYDTEFELAIGNVNEYLESRKQ
jgi:8-oxo-dGTP pyrophosphatase MutT (NUDIX family)